MSAAGVPQLSVVLGPCTAGGAYIPCMSDENVILRKFGHIYLAGPPLVKAATGEVVTPEALGGADLHCKVSGVCDYLAETEEEGMLACRDMVDNLNVVPRDAESANRHLDLPKPLDEIIEAIPEQHDEPVDMHRILSLICDDGKVTEFKGLYGQGLIAAFARLVPLFCDASLTHAGWLVIGWALLPVMVHWVVKTPLRQPTLCSFVNNAVCLCCFSKTPLLKIKRTMISSRLGSSSQPFLPVHAQRSPWCLVAATALPTLPLVVGLQAPIFFSRGREHASDSTRTTT